MAASITGTFTIIDRATGPMKRMEAQAKKTMAAIEAAGKANDQLSGSKNKGAEAWDKETKATRNAERVLGQTRNTAQSTERAMRDLGSTNRRTARDTDGLTSALTRLGGAFAGLRGILRTLMLPAVAAGLANLLAAVGALGGGLAALVPAVVSATGALAALPAALGAAVQGMSAFKVATSGVMDALKAGVQMKTNAGRAAIDYGDQMRSAANSVRQAERGIMMSNRQARDAQEALTEARRNARRELVDQKLAAQGAALGERAAALQLRRAREALSKGAIDPTTSELDMGELSLGVREAQLNLRRQRVERRRVVQDRERAMRRGVEGNRTVRGAREGVADAAYQQGEAIRQLADAQRQANRLTRQGTADNDKYQQALKQLPKPAADFVRRLVSLRSTWKGIQREAAAGLFPGLDRSLTNALRAVPLVERTLRRTGSVLGNGLAAGTDRLTSGRRLADLEGIGEQQATVLGRMVRGVFNLGEGFIDLMVAAEPFTNWLTKTVEGWTEAWAATQKFNRENGTTAARLARTRFVLERFGRIAENVWRVLRGLGRAARPLGERLWNGAERATDGWARFLESAQGATKARNWFDRLYEPLHALGQLTKALAQGWANLAVSPALVETTNAMTAATPTLTSLLERFATLGPAFVNTLGAFGEMLNSLPFEPITVLLGAMTRLFEIITKLSDAVPGLGTVLATVMSVALINRVMRMVTGVNLLGGAFRRLGTNAAGAGGGIRAAFGSLPGAFGRGYSRGRAQGQNPLSSAWRGARGAGAGFGRMAGAGGVAGLAGMMAAPLVGSAIGGTGGATVGGAMGGAAMGGMIAGPWGALAGGIIGGIGGLLSGRAAERESDYNTNVTTVQDAVAGITRNNGRGLGGTRRQIGDLRALRGRVYEQNPEGRDDLIRALNNEIQARKDLLPGLRAEARARNIARGNQFAGRLRESFHRDAMGMGGRRAAVSALAGDTAAMIRNSRGYEEARRGSQGAIAILREEIRKGTPGARQALNRVMQSFERRYEGMGRHVRRVGNRIIDGSRRTWKHLSGAISDPLERARQRARGSLTAIQRYMKTNLILGGVSERVAAREIRRAERTGNAPRSAGQILGAQARAAAAVARGAQSGRDIATGGHNPFDFFGGNSAPGRNTGPNRGNPLFGGESNRAVLNSFADPFLKLPVKVKKPLGDTRAESDRLKTKVVNDSRTIATQTKTNWDKASSSIIGNAQKANSQAGRAMADLRSQAMSQLMGFGNTRAEASRILSGGQSAAAKHPHAKGGRVPYASGGRIPGVGTRDTVPVYAHGGHVGMAAPGELIVNRHTEQRVNRKLQVFGTTLGGEVAGERRPHYSGLVAGDTDTTSNRRAMFATGGRIDLRGARAGLGPIAQLALSRSGLSVTSGKNDHGKYTSSGNISDHWYGRALDLSNGSAPTPGMDSFNAFSKQRLRGLIKQLIWRDKDQFNGAPIGGHMDHIHWAMKEQYADRPDYVSSIIRKAVKGFRFMGGGGPALDQAIKLHAKLAALRSIGGAPGAAGIGAVQGVRRGMLQSVNGQLGDGGGGGGTYRGPLDRVFPSHRGTGGARLSPGQVRMLARRAGLPPWFWKIAKGESSFYPGIIGDDPNGFSHGRGLYQITPEVQSAQTRAHLEGMGSYFNPWTNTRMAKWMYDQADVKTPGVAGFPWYGTKYLAQGGRVPWYGQGTDFIATRPQVIGVGDGGGRERVTVTPTGKQGARGEQNITVNIERIEYNGPGDIRKAVRRELELVADDIAAMGA